MKIHLHIRITSPAWYTSGRQRFKTNMVVHRPFLLFLITPLGLVAQSPAVDFRPVAAQSQPQAGAVPGSIEGRVTNGQTGDGLGGATIRLAPMRMQRSGAAAADATATTAADGSFHFDSVAPGTYFAVVEDKGFVSRGSRAGLRPVTVSSGQQVSNVNLALMPQATISGKVVDGDGNSQAGARVEAFTEHVIRGRLQLFRVSQSTTNQAGQYNLAGLSPGKYYLAAELLQRTNAKDAGTPGEAKPNTPKSEGSATGQPPMELVRTYYPKSLDFNSAEAVDVESGQDLSGTVIQLRRVATHHVQGTVSGLTGAAVQRDELFLAPKAGVQSASFGRRGKLSPDGKFIFDHVVPGEYTLRLVGNDASSGQSPRFRSRHLLARQDVEVGASDVEGVDLAVLSPIVLTGRVSVDGVDNPNFSQIHIAIAPAADDVAYGSYQNAQVAADGTFSMENLSPAKYVVHATGGPVGTYLKSLTFNGQDLLTQEMDLSQGSGGELAVAFHTGVAEIDGTVQTSSQPSQIPLASPTGGQAASPFPMVVLVPDHLAPDGTGWLVGAAQPSGAFTLPNVRPGRYTAFAVEHFDGTVWQNTDFLKEIQSEGISVDVGENDRKQIQLATISNDQIQQALARVTTQQ